jgi:hypothetical protein
MSQSLSTNPLPLLDSAAIAANHAGQMTPWQRSQIKLPSLVWPLLGLLVLVAVMLPVLVSINLYADQMLLPMSLSLLLKVPLLLFVLLLAWPFVLLFLRLSDQVRKGLSVREDVAAGRLASANGEVTFTTQGYRARMAGHRMWNLAGEPEVRLPPGTYRLTYLSRSRRILSGEWQGSREPGGPYAGLLQVLAQTNAFDLDDLAMNRYGRLSEAQRARLSRSKRDPELRADVQEGRVEMADGYAQATFFLSDYGSSGSYYYVFPEVAFPVSQDAAGRSGRAQRTDRPEPHPEQRAPERATPGWIPTAWPRVVPLRCEVPQQAYLALLAGLRYRVYYFPRTHRLLSIEPLPSSALTNPITP